MKQKTARTLFMLLYVAWVLVVVYVAGSMLIDAIPTDEPAEAETTPHPPTTETETETDIPGYNPECDPDPTDDKIPENVSLPNCGDDMVFTNTSDRHD
jgi:hypothetical protein